MHSLNLYCLPCLIRPENGGDDDDYDSDGDGGDDGDDTTKSLLSIYCMPR